MVEPEEKLDKKTRGRFQLNHLAKEPSKQIHNVSDNYREPTRYKRGGSSSKTKLSS